MSQTTTITQTPAPIILGAYYELLVNQTQNGDQQEPKDYEQNICIVQSSFVGPRRPSFEDAVKFEALVIAWHHERDAASSVTDMATCPSYQRIIAMGEVAIPLILSKIGSEGDEPDHWFWALRVLADTDPVPEADRGNIVRMAHAWLNWGQQQGYAG